MSTAPAPRSRFGLVALVGVLLVGAGVAAYWFWFRDRTDLPGAVAANARGIARLERYEYELAQKEFEEAERLAPGWTPARINLGISLFNQQPDDSTKTRSAQAERAQGIFRQVLAREPDNRHARYCLGVIAQYFGDVAEAYGHFAAVVGLDPDDPHAQLRAGSCHPDGPQSAGAREHYERAIKLDPYLNEARYRLAQALMRDEPVRGRKLLDEFEGLKTAEWFTASKLDRYGEQGKYAEAVGREPRAKLPVGPLPVFDSPTGFAVVLAAGTRWATPADLDPVRKAARERFGGTVVLLDYNRDGRPDVLLLSAVVQDGKVRDLLLRNDLDFKFTDVTAPAGLAGPRPSLGAAAADYDNDGFVDLVITGAGAQHLFRSKGDGTFEDATGPAGLDKVAGVCLGCGWADLDQDCDLDLVLCRYAVADAGGFAGDGPKGGGVVLLENVGEAPPGARGGPLAGLMTAFRANPALETAAGACAAVSVVIADLDGDQDADVLVLADRADPVPLENDRLLRFRKTTPTWAADKPHRWNGGLAFIATHSDRPDLLLTRADGPPLFLVTSGTIGFAAGTIDSPTLRQAMGVDLDLDGWADAVGLADGPALVHNQSESRLAHAANAFGLAGDLPANVRGLACADLTGDGNPDLLVWSDAGLALRRNAGNGHKALQVEPTGRKDPSTFMRTNASGIGCRIAAQAGRHWTAAERTTGTAGLGQSLVPLNLGMGKNDQAEYVQARWPDGIHQVELAVGVGPVLNLAEFSRKSTSCPVLMTWDGERYVFVTDFLGAGAMGEMGPDGTARPPRPEESVKIDAAQLKLINGQYRLKVTEPMDEVIYLDHIRLDVVDHPAGSVVFPDERFATSDPQPTQQLLAFRDRRFPKKVTDHRGSDHTKAVLERDRQAPDGFRLRSWIGFAEDHALTFDFGDLPAAKTWHLVWAGWTEYPYSESIYAADRAGVPVKFPVVERLAADGTSWEPLGDLGFPAGLPRVMTRPLDLKPGPCVLRVRTNMQVYFDQVYLAPAEDLRIKVHALDVSKADLAARGIIQEVFPDGRPPVAYDDARTEAVPMTRWKGRLTRTGDVTDLLAAGDDRFVLFGPGDEVTVRFDASRLPPVPAGWERSFVLRSRGYSKDTAPFTATWGHTLPLPFRAMKNYPDFGGVQPPRTDADRWNTRPFGGR